MKLQIASVDILQSSLRGFALICCLASGMLAGAAPAAAAPFAYVTNAFGPNVSVIDTADNSLAATIPFPASATPFAVAITPDGKHAYVTTLNSFSTAGGAVSLIDTTTNAIVGEPIIVGDEPTGIAITPDGKRAYVANSLRGGISVIDTASNTVTATIRLDGSPWAVAITPDGQRAYVTNESFENVAIIDTATNTVQPTAIPVGIAPQGIAITPDGKHLYVANSAFPGIGISVIDTTTNSVVTTVPVDNNPSAVAITPDGTRAYVTNGGSLSVSVIDTASNTVVGSAIPVGTFPGAVAITPDGKRAYVTNEGSANASVIDTATNTVISTIEGMASPRGVAITPIVSSAPAATLDAHIQIFTGKPGTALFFAEGTFTLGDGNTSIEPEAETWAFSLADVVGEFFSETLPAGSFHRIGNKAFFFQSREDVAGVNSVLLRRTDDAKKYTFIMLAQRLSLRSPITPPLSVSFQIGDDRGIQTAACRHFFKQLTCH